MCDLQAGESRRQRVRLREGAPLLVFFCFFLAFAPAVLSGKREIPNQPIFDIVAVGRGPGQIVLATPAAPSAKMEWRFRRISISPPKETVRDVVLSPSGTKALVDFGDGQRTILDLTKPVSEIREGDSPAPQHRLAQARFPFSRDGGEICLADDEAHLIAGSCTGAVAAAVHEDGRILYANVDGVLFILDPGAGQSEVLPYRVPTGAHVQFLAGKPGDRRDFLVLVTRKADGLASGAVTTIVDPRNPESAIGQYSDPRAAAMHGLLALSGNDAGAQEEAPTQTQRDSAPEILAARLSRQFQTGAFSWSFYRVAADEAIYAPVLEFAAGEPDYPSGVDFWREITASAPRGSLDDYRRAYARMGDRRWSECTYYERTLSFPGTWLIEYWFYYPFDEGKAHPHIHDSEHFFVEVDKLGGAVRNVFASDHDSFVPNNIYSTLVKGALPVSLPLYAMVERGKHAMAPDMNRDGQFARGVDDNLHTDRYTFWGLRDESTKFHFMMEPYLASMNLPREREGRFALEDASRLYAGIEDGVPADHMVCKLRPFPEDPPGHKKDSSVEEAAVAQLLDHPDARRPENIYKPYVVPWSEVRVGAGIYDWTESRGQFTVAYAGDFLRMSGGLLPLPARIALEFGVTPFGRATPMKLGGQNRFVFSRTTLYGGFSVERLLTNTQGIYSGMALKWADISASATSGVVSPAPLHWQYGGISYHLGYVLELPSAHKTNFTNHIGIVIQDSPSFPVLFEWRVSFGIFRRRGRHDFGARVNDRNPYETAQ